MNQFALLVVMYHYIRDPGDAAENGSGIPGLPVSSFEAQLDYLMANYEMTGWSELRAYLSSSGSLPLQACLLTFDDGIRDHYLNVYPALRARNLSGLFFALARRDGMGLTLGHKIHFLIAHLGFNLLRESFYDRLGAMQQVAFDKAEAKYRSPQRMGGSDSDDNSHNLYSPSKELELFKLVLQRDLSDIADPILGQLLEESVGPDVEIARDFFLNHDQILEMVGGGMHFGGHSQSHPWFDRIDDRRLAQEIGASSHWLSTFEERPWSFAYPYGGLNPRTPALLKANGFVGAFTTHSKRTHTDPFLIGRYEAESFREEMMFWNSPGGS